MEAPEDADDSPDSDLRSSVSREGGEDAVEGEEMSARESSDMERSRGESVREKQKHCHLLDLNVTSP